MALLLASCVHSLGALPASWEGDRSIVFPSFHAQSALQVGTESRPYELGGRLLQAVRVAMDDFIPPGSNEERPCRGRPEAYRSRVIRQGDVFFILIHEDPEACGAQYVGVDTDARYAVSLDGRILRRSVGAEPELPLSSEPADAGVPDAGDAPHPPIPSGPLDGGTL
ncbi:hypothetical protein OV208_25220 [Corallococcus sp. bb12-1]|uniref:hypothetical protein n=1 Tax=Corallococcus sp. bb12-1 TaxID=2996784 RepID=UPI0022700279|nr:hypothetical protein [Corallococcus sp. bb12-1]MCY1044643.1 hypothetical protein [Corallococcus sp. bb12-1]